MKPSGTRGLRRGGEMTVEGRYLIKTGGFLTVECGRGILDLSFSTRDTQEAMPKGSASPRMGPRHVPCEKAP